MNASEEAWADEVNRKLENLAERVQSLEAERGGLVGCRVQIIGPRGHSYWNSYGKVVSVTRSEFGQAFVVVRFSDGVLGDFTVQQVRVV